VANNKSFREPWKFEGIAASYETFLVPLLSKWTEQLFDSIKLKSGDRLLDVACGTGIVARLAAEYVGNTGQITGLDITPDMLKVARSLSETIQPAIKWREGNATELPFADATFDVVVCQQGLQFFPDPLVALKEMRRVLAPGGRVGLSVWRSTEFNPGYEILAKAIERHLTPEAAAMMRAPFAFGDTNKLRALLTQAGFGDVRIQFAIREARFPSPEDLLRREVVSWLAGVIGELTDSVRDALIAETTEALQPNLDDDGLIFPMETQVVVAYS
jgi:ubiquinone/menaquinone biosynthesis C-methylase UbiE